MSGVKLKLILMFQLHELSFALLRQAWKQNTVNMSFFHQARMSQARLQTSPSRRMAPACTGRSAPSWACPP